MNDEQIFRGQTADPRDRARLSAQIERIRAWAIAREWFTLREAGEDLERIYAPTLFPESSFSAQLRNLSKRAAGRLRCRREKRHRGGGIWEYRMRALPVNISEQPAKLESDDAIEKITWPATFEQLEAAGYGCASRGKQCSCGDRPLWFITPRGKWMLFSVLEDSRLVPHHATCSNVKQFRAANAKHAARATAQPAQASLF